jgi:hydrogenase expression/formation protein HypC
MCLGVPMKVCSVSGNNAAVEFGSLRREADVRFLEDVKPGDYVIVHAGFAIQKVDEEESLRTLELIREMGEGKI